MKQNKSIIMHAYQAKSGATPNSIEYYVVLFYRFFFRNIYNVVLNIRPSLYILLLQILHIYILA